MLKKFMLSVLSLTILVGAGYAASKGGNASVDLAKVKQDIQTLQKDVDLLGKDAMAGTAKQKDAEGKKEKEPEVKKAAATGAPGAGKLIFNPLEDFDTCLDASDARCKGCRSDALKNQGVDAVKCKKYLKAGKSPITKK